MVIYHIWMANVLGGRQRTSGPGWDSEGDVTLREEQQDATRHGTERKAIGPTITEAAYSI